jgi:hypothetical protein
VQAGYVHILHPHLFFLYACVIDQSAHVANGPEHFTHRYLAGDASAAKISALPPFRLMKSTTPSAASAYSGSVHKFRYPISTATMAVAVPMPRLAPVVLFYSRCFN